MCVCVYEIIKGTGGGGQTDMSLSLGSIICKLHDLSYLCFLICKMGIIAMPVS